MIQLGSDLFLLPREENIRGTLGYSSDVLFQWTFNAWVQFLDSGRVTYTNLGIMSQWSEPDFITFLSNEAEIRRKIHGNITALADQEGDYYFVDAKLHRYLRTVLTGWDKVFFCDWMRCVKEGQVHFLLDKPYYCGFVENLFGTPIQYLRQKGQSYYFVQKYKELLLVPNIVTIETARLQIVSRVQKLNSTPQQSWNEFCKYFYKEFKINIRYGRTADRQPREKDYWQRQRENARRNNYRKGR